VNGESRPEAAPAVPDQGDRSTVTQTADTLTPAQKWAAAWLAGEHTEPHCATCAAGWALIGGTP
jgi:hypothetical protein